MVIRQDAGYFNLLVFVETCFVISFGESSTRCFNTWDSILHLLYSVGETCPFVGFLLHFLNFSFPIFCQLEFSSVILIILSCLELISLLYFIVFWFVFFTNFIKGFTPSLRYSYIIIIVILKFWSCFRYCAFSEPTVVGFLGSGGYILSHLFMTVFCTGI